MNKTIQFGEYITGFSIPVLNEREIRAAAGILFLIMFTSFLLIVTRGDYTLLKYGIVAFLTDFSIRVFINPKYAPTLILGRLIVSNQTPEFVGAKQKKFAWKIGFGIAITMFVLVILLNSRSPINGVFCFACLTFLFFESAFGICLGCKFYPYFTKEKVQYCPGEICDINARHDIQKTSRTQLLILLAFVGFILVTVFLFNDIFVQPPLELFGSDTVNAAAG